MIGELIDYDWWIKSNGSMWKCQTTILVCQVMTKIENLFTVVEEFYIPTHVKHQNLQWHVDHSTLHSFFFKKQTHTHLREKEWDSNSVLYYDCILNKHNSLKGPMKNKPRKICSHQIFLIFLLIPEIFVLRRT